MTHPTRFASRKTLHALLALCPLWLISPARAQTDHGDAKILRERVAQAIARRNAVVSVPPGQYELAEPLRLDGAVGLTWDAAGVTLKANLGPQYADHAVLDMLGAADCEIRNLRIETVKPVKVGILLGRRSYSGGNARNRFYAVQIKGHFAYNVYNVGAELDVWDMCRMWNYAPGGVNYFAGDWNSRGVKSTGAWEAGRMVGGPHQQSTLDHTLRNCVLGVYAADAVNIVIEPRVQDFRIVDCCFSNRSGGRTWLELSHADDSFGVRNIVVRGALCETWGTRHALLFRGNAWDVHIQDTRLYSGREPIHLDAGVRVYNLRLDSVSFGQK